MTVTLEYRNRFLPIKYFLSSYRALSDGQVGLRTLEQHVKSTDLLFSDWKISWVGTCTILRTSIDLFRVDAKSCINRKIRASLKDEWSVIRENKEDHQIFWKFLRKERDSIIHEYRWTAYEVWLKEDGTHQTPPLSLLRMRPDDAESVLLMSSGYYKGHNSLDLLRESAAWVEERIFSAIDRAGFDPEEERNLWNFRVKPPRDHTLFDHINEEQ